jgi:hypothetical protein
MKIIGKLFFTYSELRRISRLILESVEAGQIYISGNAFS